METIRGAAARRSFVVDTVLRILMAYQRFCEMYCSIWSLVETTFAFIS